MKLELKEMLDNYELTEQELGDFLRTIRKFGKKGLMDERNFQFVLEHFEIKKKRGWIKLEKGRKFKL